VALFCLSAFLTICFGWISIFPVIYEFFYLIYLFLFKQLAVNSDKLGPEFTKRMSSLMTGFVILAVIVAVIQLPLTSAGVIAGIVLLARWFMKNKSSRKSA
jgi:cobalamin synthase